MMENILVPKWGQRRGRPKLGWRAQPVLSKALLGPYVGKIYACHVLPPDSSPAGSPLPHRRGPRTKKYVTLKYWPKGWRQNDSRTAPERFIDGRRLETGLKVHP
jgi:hypothetical protein